MVHFDSVARTHTDFWYDHECGVVQAQVERLSPNEWEEFERQCMALPAGTQERIAYVLGEIDSASSARILLQLCSSPERDTVLTAREALRSLTFESVRQGALSLSPAVIGGSINEILDRLRSSETPATDNRS